MIVLKTKADIKNLKADVGKMMKILDITAKEQARDLAASACYVAARLSFPADKKKETGGASMTAKAHERKQNENIRATVETLFWDFDPRRSNPAETMRSVSEVLSHHDKAAKKNGKYVKSLKLARWYSRHRNAKPSDKQAAIKSLQKWVGWGKAGWISAMFRINKAAKRRVPAYVKRHVGAAKSSVRVDMQKGSYQYIVTNETSQSGNLLDKNGMGPALLAAIRGQILRLRKQTDKFLIGQIKR